MEKSRGRLRLGLFLFLLLLLLPQASLGARSRLRILNLMDTSDEMQIECHDTNFKRPATFKLINPVNGTVVREVNNLTLIISVFPHNETVVRCQINGFEESESIAIAGKSSSSSALKTKICLSCTCVFWNCRSTTVHG